MQHRVGKCSICGGDVMGYRGAWSSILPPPPDECTMCGAIAASQSDVIPMVPRPQRNYRQVTSNMTTATWNSPVKVSTTSIIDARSAWRDIEGKWHNCELL